MESYPLNKAHQLERQAESLLRQKKFDECMECYKGAISHLQGSLLCTDNQKSQESIQLQIDHNNKLIDSLRIKEAQYTDRCRSKDTLKDKIGNLNYNKCESGALQREIFRTMEAHDSLIEVVQRRGHTDDESETEDKRAEEVIKVYKKKQVDDATIIEEFKGLCEKLRELVEVLAVQVEEKDCELSRLKTEITRLQGEKDRSNKTDNALRVITDSSGGTSPYVFSPCSELSPDALEIRAPPSLTPMEMPNLDLLNLNDMKNFTSSNN